MEKSFTKRLQELAGITEESKMISRIDQEIEKAKERGDIDDDNDFESGSDEWYDFISSVYQVPFDYDEYDLEGFIELIHKKAKELNFPFKQFLDYLETKGIDFV